MYTPFTYSVRTWIGLKTLSSLVTPTFFHLQPEVNLKIILAIYRGVSFSRDRVDLARLSQIESDRLRSTQIESDRLKITNNFQCQREIELIPQDFH